MTRPLPRQKRFHDLTREAFGGRLPDIGSHFQADEGDTIVFEVTLFDHALSWFVRMPALAVVAHLATIDDSLQIADNEEWGKRERTYKVRVLDAIAYALVSEQHDQFFRARYGLYFNEATEAAYERWSQTTDLPL